MLSQFLAIEFENKALRRFNIFLELKWLIPKKESSYPNKSILLTWLKK